MITVTSLTGGGVRGTFNGRTENINEGSAATKVITEVFYLQEKIDTTAYICGPENLTPS
jgi:hypothetical protein